MVGILLLRITVPQIKKKVLVAPRVSKEYCKTNSSNFDFEIPRSSAEFIEQSINRDKPNLHLRTWPRPVYIRSRETPKRMDQEKDRSTHLTTYLAALSGWNCTEEPFVDQCHKLHGMNEWVSSLSKKNVVDDPISSISSLHPTHGPNFHNLGWNGSTHAQN